MGKNIKLGLIVCSVLGTIGMTEKGVRATKIDETQNIEATIGFIPKTKYDGIRPVNPNTMVPDANRPEKNITSGLSLDYASNLRFKSQIVSFKAESYLAEPDKIGGTDVPNYVQVTDQRANINDTWKLHIKQNDPFRDMKSQKELNDATLTLKSITSSLVSFKTIPELQLNDAYQVLAQPQKGDGIGTHVIKFGDVQLDVSAKTQRFIGNYRTTLTYNLVSEP